MRNLVTDQADGLRRLMASNLGRRVAVVGCVAADTAAFMRNLAAALVQEGTEVALLDERRDVLHAGHQGDDRLVLIHAALDASGALSTAAAEADHILIVLQADAASIKASYACIKGMRGNHALQSLRILVEGAAEAPEAQHILANLADAGRRYLSLVLDPAGWVRADPHLARSKRLNVTVVEAFKNSRAAMDYRHVARDLLQWPQVRTDGQARRSSPVVVGACELALH